MTMTAATEAATVAGAPRLWCSRSRASKRQWQSVRVSDWQPVSMLITCRQYVANWLLQIWCRSHFFRHTRTSKDLGNELAQYLKWMKKNQAPNLSK